MILADVIQIALLVVVIAQLGWAIYSFNKSYRLQRLELHADHERRKKEATILHVNNIREKYRGLRLELDSKFGEGRTINVDEIDDDARNKMKEMLSLMEHLAAGVNTNVFDFDMIYLMSGSYFSGIYERSLPFVNERRRMTGRDGLYIEFEHMVERIRNRKRLARNRRADLEELPKD